MEEKSHYASAARSTTEQILNEYEIVGSHKFFTDIFGAMTGIGAVINKNRQIVYANNEFLKLLGIGSVEILLGKRPGEVVACEHAGEEAGGCGTARACAYCGVVNTVLESQKNGSRVTKEAHISTLENKKFKSWDMSIVSTPITFNNEIYYVLILQDISEKKRIAALERIFFHDLLNSVGGLYGLLSVLKDELHSPEQTKELISLSEEASRNIIEEILAQRQIRSAENGELTVNIESANSIEVINAAISKIGYHEAGKERRLIRDEKSVNIDFQTDKALIQRILINLIKNALEASGANSVVVAGVEEEDDEIVFWVKNDEVMPEEVQLQMFHRSFSTKGSGRGLGSYSIRMLTENYLLGKAGFVSNETDGTIFTIRLKKEFPNE
jgi:nitrogen-specific signal transduction histidine kinase